MLLLTPLSLTDLAVLQPDIKWEVTGFSGEQNKISPNLWVCLVSKLTDAKSDFFLIYFFTMIPVTKTDFSWDLRLSPQRQAKYKDKIFAAVTVGPISANKVGVKVSMCLFQSS